MVWCVRIISKLYPYPILYTPNHNLGTVWLRLLCTAHNLGCFRLVHQADCWVTSNVNRRTISRPVLSLPAVLEVTLGSHSPYHSEQLWPGQSELTLRIIMPKSRSTMALKTTGRVNRNRNRVSVAQQNGDLSPQEIFNKSSVSRTMSSQSPQNRIICLNGLQLYCNVQVCCYFTSHQSVNILNLWNLV